MFAEAGNSVHRMPVHSVGLRSWFAILFPMDVERIIHDIQQLEEMYEAPDIRSLNASDVSAAYRRHDETLANSPWFRSGRILVSAAGPGTRCSQRLNDSRVQFHRFRRQPELRRCGLAFIGVGDSAANTVAGLFPGCREAICLPPLRRMGYRQG